ncbi:unnamed protein product, partial [Mesorhabditis spiculigera]
MHSVFSILLLLLAVAITVVESRGRQDNTCNGEKCEWWQFCCATLQECLRAKSFAPGPYAVHYLLLLLVVVPAVSLDWCLDDSQCAGVDGYCFINRCSVKVNGVATDRLCAGGRLVCGDGEFCCKLPHVADGGYCAKVVDGGCLAGK